MTCTRTTLGSSEERLRAVGGLARLLDDDCDVEGYVDGGDSDYGDNGNDADDYDDGDAHDDFTGDDAEHACDCDADGDGDDYAD